ncbi:amphi-Trp domain-containing protein [Fodinibius sp. AD559]|uniref:amphi-Trp domain-containing protein n=1 Tax=Fodinibius sp. AD559 TaxID=3424179 RepID=UPI004046F603
MEQKQSLNKIADFLEKIVGNIRQGHITFSDDCKLDRPENVIPNIDVDRRTKPDVTATSAEIELKWEE